MITVPLQVSGCRILMKGVATFEALDAVELSQQLVDHPVGDASGVVAPLGRDGVKLVKEEDARRCCRRLPAPAAFTSGGQHLMVAAYGHTGSMVLISAAAVNRGAESRYSVRN